MSFLKSAVMVDLAYLINGSHRDNEQLHGGLTIEVILLGTVA